MEKTITVEAGSVKVGDTINGGVVARLGRVQTIRVTDDNSCAYGLEPGLDRYPTIREQDVTVRS